VQERSTYPQAEDGHGDSPEQKVPCARTHSTLLATREGCSDNLRKLSEKVRWRSWLSHLSNTQKAPGSSPGRTIILPDLTGNLPRVGQGVSNHSIPATIQHMFRCLLLWAVLSYLTLSHVAASLGERALPSISSSALEDLANMRDPAKNLDPSDPYSHLQKILIPRTRASIQFVPNLPLTSACSRH
jgi:hypothetical protein